MTEQQGLGKARAPVLLARVGELVDYRTPWHRRLWSAGTILELHEILEYSGGLRGTAPSREEKAFTELKGNVAKRIAKDKGIGNLDFRGRLRSLLGELRITSEYDFSRLELLLRKAETGYLDRWAAAARSGEETEERIARHLAESLLDRGVNPDKIHHWVNRNRELAQSLETDPQRDSVWMGELVSEAEELAETVEAQRTVGVPFREYSLGTRPALPKDAILLDPRRAQEWLSRDCGADKT